MKPIFYSFAVATVAGALSATAPAIMADTKIGPTSTYSMEANMDHPMISMEYHPVGHMSYGNYRCVRKIHTERGVIMRCLYPRRYETWRGSSVHHQRARFYCPPGTYMISLPPWKIDRLCNTWRSRGSHHNRW